MGTFASPQIITIENQDRRRTRSLRFSMAGATGVQSEEFPYASPTGTVWFKLVVPEGVSGIFAAGPRVTEAEVETWNIAWPNFVAIGGVIHRQEGMGLEGLDRLDGSSWSVSPPYSPPPVGVRLNCEGHLQGRATPWFQRAIRGGETYYVEVGMYLYDYSRWPDSYTEAPFSATIEWSFEADEDPVEFVEERSLPECPGETLATWGRDIFYFSVESGWPAWLKSGTKSVPNAPALPALGHMFGVVESHESWTVHTRNILVAWTEESGPFFYGHLNLDHDMRTWTVDDTEISNEGAGSPDGQNHVGVYADYRSDRERDEVRSNIGLAAEPTAGWGQVRADITMVWMLNSYLFTLAFERWESDPQISPHAGTAQTYAVLAGVGTTDTVVRINKNGSFATDITIPAGETLALGADFSIAVGDVMTTEVIGSSDAYNLTVYLGVLP